MAKFLKNPSQKILDNDPGMIYVTSLIDMFRSKIQMAQMQREEELSELKGLFMQAIQDKETNKTFYPDANSTMRITYGTVKNYKSWEGKEYETFTTGDQILDKYVAGGHEFDVPEKLRTLLSNKDFGRKVRRF